MHGMRNTRLLAKGMCIQCDLLISCFFCGTFGVVSTKREKCVPTATQNMGGTKKQLEQCLRIYATRDGTVILYHLYPDIVWLRLLEGWLKVARWGIFASSPCGWELGFAEAFQKIKLYSL